MVIPSDSRGLSAELVAPPTDFKVTTRERKWRVCVAAVAALGKQLVPRGLAGDLANGKSLCKSNLIRIRSGRKSERGGGGEEMFTPCLQKT